MAMQTKGMRLAPWRSRSRLYLTVFAAVPLVFFAFAGILSLGASDYRDYELELSSIPDTALILESGLNRSDVAAIKLGHIERSDPYDVLLLGNHQFKYFSSDAFDDVAPDLSFFNLWYANLSVTELADLTEFLAAQGRLPSRALLIQITSPNNDNGKYIVGRNGELLPDIRAFAGELADRSVIEFLADTFGAAVERVTRAVDYATLIHALTRRDETSRLIDTALCEEVDGPVRDTSGAGTLLSGLLGQSAGDACNPAQWIDAFRRDGARNDRYVIADPTLDANPLEPQNSYLTVADIPTLAEDMRRIHDATAAAGVAAIFVIPPVYESERQSDVDRVMGLVLEGNPDLNVVDHRAMRRPSSLFVTYDHPSSEYFQALARDLSARGYLSPGHGE